MSEILRIVYDSITRWLDFRAIAQQREKEMQQRTHTKDALQLLRDRLECMLITVDAALRGDDEALDEVITEFGGPYTVVARLVTDVAHGIQWDDGDEAVKAFLEKMDDEDDLEHCKGG